MNEKIDPPQGNFYRTVSNLRGFGFVLYRNHFKWIEQKSDLKKKFV